MMALRLPLILVTGSDPAPSATRSTALDALYRRDINLLAIIVSETPGNRVRSTTRLRPFPASPSRSRPAAPAARRRFSPGPHLGFGRTPI